MPRLNKTQQIIAGFVYIVVGIIAFLMLISFVMRLFGFGLPSLFNFLAGPFYNVYPEVRLGSLIINPSLIVAATIYLVIGYLVMLVLTAVFVLNPFKIIRNIFSALFRILEFVILMRFFFKLLFASSASSFVAFIYQITNFIPATLSIFPTINIFSSELEISSFVLFIIILFIDTLIWNLLTIFIGDNTNERNY